MKARRCECRPIRLNGAMANKNSFSAKGPSQRQLRVGELIRRTLSELLSRSEIHDTDLNRMYITVGEVAVSADLRVATVYVMPLIGVLHIFRQIDQHRTRPAALHGAGPQRLGAAQAGVGRNDAQAFAGTAVPR